MLIRSTVGGGMCVLICNTVGGGMCVLIPSTVGGGWWDVCVDTSRTCADYMAANLG